MSKKIVMRFFNGVFQSTGYPTGLILITFCLLLGDALSTDYNHDQQNHAIAFHHHHHLNLAQMKPPFSPNQTLMNQPNRTGEDEEWLNNLGKLHQKVSLFRNFYLYTGTFITIMGATLNTLCIVVFYKSKLFRNSSFPYYVYVISLVDILNVFLRFVVPQAYEKYVRNSLESDYGISRDLINTVYYDYYTTKIVREYDCSLYIYVLNSLTLVSVWLMVAVSLERLIVIKFALQTKRMIKLRAIFILVLIFFITFGLNVFDLAPGLYIAPTWYANITLLCERDDTVSEMHANSSHIIKSLGSFQFDTQVFILARTIMQTVVPFLLVLVFNSLIIYNFKKIKTTAFSYSNPEVNHVPRAKSNSCVSVASAGSFASSAGNYNMPSHKEMFIKNNINGSSSQKDHMLSISSSRQRRSRAAKLASRSSQNNASLSPCHHQLQIPSTVNNSRSTPNYRLSCQNHHSSSRSPSPLNTISIPATPTSLVSALNLAEQTRGEKNNEIENKNLDLKNCPTVPTTPTTAANNATFESPSRQCNCNCLSQNESTKQLLTPNRVGGIACTKQYSNPFLMPPTNLSMTSSSQAATTLTTNCCSCSSRTPSLGTNNSSANLSIATMTNLTTTTTSGMPKSPNQAQSQNRIQREQVNKPQHLSEISTPVKQSSERISFFVTTPNGEESGTPLKAKVTTVNASTNTSRVSFKGSRTHRNSARMKLNRETDIMLIVLSFSILLSQLPCTISWYLIYYRNILKDFKDHIFLIGLSPIYLFSIRLIEMIYFSLNFFFYITLSPSLRREIKTYISKAVIENFFSMSKKRKGPLPQSPLKNPRHQLNNEEKASIMARRKENLPNSSDRGNNKEVDSLTPLPSPNICKHHLNLSKPNHLQRGGDSGGSNKLRLHSNSSGEFMDYFGGKLRSISPLRRPNSLLKSAESSSGLPSPFLTVTNHSEKKLNHKYPQHCEMTKVDDETGANRRGVAFILRPIKKYFRSNSNQNKNTILNGGVIKASPTKAKTSPTYAKALINNKNSKIKIVIDNLYDEEEELKIDQDIILDKYDLNMNENCSSFDSISCEKGRTREKDSLFNWGSLLTALDDGKLNPLRKKKRENGSAELSDNQIAYL